MLFVCHPLYTSIKRYKYNHYYIVFAMDNSWKVLRYLALLSDPLIKLVVLRNLVLFVEVNIMSAFHRCNLETVGSSNVNSHGFSSYLIGELAGFHKCILYLKRLIFKAWLYSLFCLIFTGNGLY